MRNKIVDYHPILGNITFEDLVNDLNDVIKDYKTLEDRIYNILHYNNYDDETISALLTNCISYNLNYVYSIIKSLL